MKSKILFVFPVGHRSDHGPYGNWKLWGNIDDDEERARAHLPDAVDVIRAEGPCIIKWNGCTNWNQEGVIWRYSLEGIMAQLGKWKLGQGSFRK